MNQKQKEILLEIARKSILEEFDEGMEEKFDLNKYKFLEFSKKQGAFVTLTKRGELRGCIGFVEGIFPLYETIYKVAKSAAFEDSRFPRLKKEEMKEIKIEISVLSVPEEIKAEKPEDYIKQIKVGEDGLIIKKGFASGLLLPQVFPEYNADAKMALEMTCKKAGLPKDVWEEGAKVFKFQAEVFSE